MLLLSFKKFHLMTYSISNILLCVICFHKKDSFALMMTSNLYEDLSVMIILFLTLEIIFMLYIDP